MQHLKKVLRDECENLENKKSLETEAHSVFAGNSTQGSWGSYPFHCEELPTIIKYELSVVSK